MDILQTKNIFSSVYHPSTQGVAEKFNTTILKGLKHYANEKQDDWDEYLAPTLFAYRTALHEGKEVTPFELNFARLPELPPDPKYLPSNESHLSGQEYVNKLKDKLQHYHSSAIKMENKTKGKQQAKADMNPQMFQEDELVLLKRMTYPKGKSPKIISRWTGPFAIEKVLRNNSYMLRGISGQVLKYPVNYDRLKKYHSKLPPLAVRDETHASVPEFQDLQENNVFEVEKIKGHKKKDDGMYYLVKWKGYPNSQNTYEPESNLTRALVKTYWDAQRKVNHITRSVERNNASPWKLSLIPSMMVVFFLLMGIPTAGGNEPRLGRLYDCTNPIPLGIYQKQTSKTCDSLNDDANTTISQLHVYKYSPTTTRFPMYVCAKTKYHHQCIHHYDFGPEVFLYEIRTTWQTTITKVPVEKLECEGWLNQTVVDKPTQTSDRFTKDGNKFSSHVQELPACDEARKTVTRWLKEVIIVQGQITGADDHLYTNFAHTNCGNFSSVKHTYEACRPLKENQPDQDYILMYKKHKHDDRDFKLMGKFKGIRVNNYISIPQIGLAGHIAKIIDLNTKWQAKSPIIYPPVSFKRYLYQMDNGYLFSHSAQEISHELNQFSALRKYAEQTLSLHIFPIVEGHLVNSIINQKKQLVRENRRLCEMQMEHTRLYNWITQHFPSTSNLWIRRHQSTIVKALGDALLISQCHPVSDYNVSWSRMHNGTCYLDFPVYQQATGGIPTNLSDDLTLIGFLQLQDRQIIRHSPEINCDSRPKLTFVIDRNGDSFRLLSNGSLQKTRNPLESYDDLHMVDEIKDIIGDHLQIILQEKPPIPPLTLAEINSQIFHILNGINEAQNAINQNGSQHTASPFAAMTHGIGSFLSGFSPSNIIQSIGNAFTGTVSAAGDAGSKLVHALGDATSQVIDSTGGAIEKVESGFGEMVSNIFGGIGSFVIAIYLVFLTILVLYVGRRELPFLNRYTHNQNSRATHLPPPLPARELPQLNSPPREIHITVDNKKPNRRKKPVQQAARV